MSNLNDMIANMLNVDSARKTLSDFFTGSMSPQELAQQAKRENALAQQYGFETQGIETAYGPEDMISGGVAGVMTAPVKSLGRFLFEAATDPAYEAVLNYVAQDNDGLGLAALPTKKAVQNRLVERAKNFFGTTPNPRGAGYIMHDGDMLDFTGRHYGDPGPSPSRNVDHRELAGESRYNEWKYEDLSPSTGGGSAGMFDFMGESGAVRWMPEANGVSMTDVPTRQQAERIVKNNRRMGGGDLYVDFDNKDTMQTIESITIDRPTADSIIKSAQQAYDGIGHKSKDFDISSVDWSKVSSYMRKHGYDIRGAEDAKNLIGKRVDNGTLSDIHKQALSYASK